MLWFWLAAGSVFFFTSMYLLQRVLAVESKDPRAMAVAFNGIAALLALGIFFLTGSYRNFALQGNVNGWIFLLIACIGYGLYERARFSFSKLLDASVFSTIENIGVVVAFVGASLLYSEPITPNKLIGTALILAALVLVSYKRNAKASKKGVMIAVLASIALGIGWALDKQGTIYFTADTYNILIWIVPLPIIIFPSIKFSAVLHEIRKSSWRIFLLSGFNVVGYLMQLKAMTMAEATRVIPIVQTATLFTVFAGIFLLNERKDIPKKIVAGFLAVVGVFFLV